MTFEQKVQRIEEHVLKKQLHVARLLSAEFRNKDSSSPFKHSGFPILLIGIAYFEMIAQLRTGVSSDGKSKRWFIKGFEFVYPQSPLNEEQIKKIHNQVRCGLYHIGSTKLSVKLSRYYCQGFSIEGDHIQINPAIVIDDLIENFSTYLCDLRVEINVQLRANFEKIWEIMSDSDPNSSSSTSSPTPATPSLWESQCLDQDYEPPTTTEAPTPTDSMWQDCTDD